MQTEDEAIRDYPFICVCRPRDGRIYRHFKFSPIPEGFFKVVWYRRKTGGKFRYYPHNHRGDLKLEYHSIERTQDVLYRESRGIK